MAETIFPPKCPFCGGLVAENGGVCPACQSRVVLRDAPPRVQTGAFYDAAAAGLWYEDDVRRVIHGLKYHQKQSFALPLARIMAYTLEQKLPDSFDLISCVPTNRRTERQRGYNQAELLGRELAGLTGTPFLRMLEKSRETQPMHGMKPEQRRANVLGAYRLCCGAEQVRGRRILLADDVLTTGATLSECARTLKENGAASVFGLCAAAARKRI